MSKIPFIAGISTPEPILLKWPNDLMQNNLAKAGGILCQSETMKPGYIAFIGIGINLKSSPEVSDRKVSHFDIDRSMFLLEFFKNFEKNLDLTNEELFE